MIQIHCIITTGGGGYNPAKHTDQENRANARRGHESQRKKREARLASSGRARASSEDVAAADHAFGLV